MNLFVIGDVHGCFNTYKKLLEQWDKEKETLIQTGDLINFGNYSFETVELSIKLHKTYPERTCFLKGDHELEIVNDFESGKLNIFYENDSDMNDKKKSIIEKKHLKWFRKLRPFWTNDNIFISHAGYSDKVQDVFYERDPYGIILNRGSKKNIGKVQIYGHIPINNGIFNYSREINSYNIDTYAYGNCYLTGLKLDRNGNLIDSISIKTLETDINI